MYFWAQLAIFVAISATIYLAISYNYCCSSYIYWLTILTSYILIFLKMCFYYELFVVIHNKQLYKQHSTLLCFHANSYYPQAIFP